MAYSIFPANRNLFTICIQIRIRLIEYPLNKDIFKRSYATLWSLAVYHMHIGWIHEHNTCICAYLKHDNTKFWKFVLT